MIVLINKIHLNLIIYIKWAKEEAAAVGEKEVEEEVGAGKERRGAQGAQGGVGRQARAMLVAGPLLLVILLEEDARIMFEPSPYSFVFIYFIQY
jgi:hypothetical protein